jgi:hypothetical protein
MQRTLYSFCLTAKQSRGKKIKKLKSFENDFEQVIKFIENRGKADRNKIKESYPQDKKILYLDENKYDSIEHSFYLKFISAKYASRRRVIDTDTMVDKGILKAEKDGDEEKTHIIIKFDGSNKAICLFESNFYGISFSKIIVYLNEYINKYHSLKKDLVNYKIESRYMVSQDFIKALNKASRIKAVTLTVDQEVVKISESKRFAGRSDLSTDLDIVVKPVARGKSITHNTVKEFLKLYNDKTKKIKKIYVDAETNDSTPLKFDTESMKEKVIVDVLETITGEVNSDDMKKELFKEIKAY